MKATVAQKIGMTQIFTEEGKAVPVTVLSLAGAFVARTLNSGDQVTHVEIGINPQKHSTKAELGQYKTANKVPRFSHMFSATSGVTIPEVGSEVKADIFAIGDKVNISGITKGKGFQGVVKRWGFRGGPKTHGGQTGKWRSPGSIGPGTTIGRVFKGKKMPGHMGVIKQTTLNLKVAFVDAERNLIGVRGAVPGPSGSYVIVTTRTYKA